MVAGCCCCVVGCAWSSLPLSHTEFRWCPLCCASCMNVGHAGLIPWRPYCMQVLYVLTCTRSCRNGVGAVATCANLECGSFWPACMHVLYERGTGCLEILATVLYASVLRIQPHVVFSCSESQKPSVPRFVSASDTQAYILDTLLYASVSHVFSRTVSCCSASQQ